LKPIIYYFIKKLVELRVVFTTKIVLLFFCVFIFSSSYGQDLSSYYDSAQAYSHKDLETYNFYTQKLLLESQKQKNKEYLLKAYYFKAIIFYDKANKDSAFFYINKALDLSRKVNDTKSTETKVDVLRLKGFVYKNRVYNKDSAFIYFKQSLDESKKSNYKYGQIKSSEAISYLLMDEGKYVDATQLLLEAREIAYRIKNKNALSSIANNIGHTYLQMYMYEKALLFFNEANRYREDKTTASIIPLNIAQCYYRTGNPKKALFILDKNAPLVIKTSLNMTIEYYLEYVNLFLEIKEPQKALEKIKILDSLVLKSKPQAQHNLLLLKAKSYLQLKDTLTAHKYIKEAEEQIPNNTDNDFANRLVMHELFSYTYTFLKDYQKAHYHSQKHIEIYKKTYNKEQEQNIYESEVNQRMVLQDKENELEKTKYAAALEKEEQNQRYFLVGLISLLSIFIVIVRAYLINKTYSKKLYNTNKTLSTTQKEVIKQNYTLSEQSAELMTQAEELKSSHEELIAINDNLESMVNQRSQEIIEKNKMLEEYAFINAHKLRAPVARLLGLMQLIDAAKNTGEVDVYLTLCKNEIKDLDRIIWAIKEAIEEKAPLDRWELEKRKEMK
jgi:tetratricopeptide (TPR) repeat protein